MKKKIIAAAAAMAMLIGTTAFAYEYPQEKDESDAPMNNSLFEVVADVNSDIEFFGLSDFTRDYNEDKSKSRIIRYTIDYSGNVSSEIITDYLNDDEYYDRLDEYLGVDDETRCTQYNDGIVYTDWQTREEPYIFADINGKYYVFYDNMRPAWGCRYNLGLVQETQTDFRYVGTENATYEFGDDNTYFYTIFSDDANYYFAKANISMFDDNGYALMKYNGKQYVVKLKRGFIPTVFYNGEKIKFDQIPVIENGRTLVPLRAIFEKLGADVEWNEDTQTVIATKDDTKISLTIDNTAASKNGESITLDVPAKVVNGRTLVPVRFVADCFGVDVDWNGTMQRVSLTSK